MFKFMKSKKGFTLVELMIVVVIMAILVAVAVPIFSAVTKNARTKTCVANLREIVSQISNKAMSEGKTYTAEITYGSDGDNVLSYNVTGADAASFSKTSFDAMFQAGAPACPAEGSYTITIGAADSTTDGSVDVSVKCEGNTDGTEDEHVYGE